MIVLAVTGGGVASISDLLSVPGASRTVLEATVPYAASALSDLIGYSPAQTVASETAEAMATACLERATQLADTDMPIAGVACTAALTTDRLRSGDNRAWIAVATPLGVRPSHLVLEKGMNDRAAEDRIVSDAVLRAIAIAVKVAE
jgi:nicotinamide mononucleotide (NMN) deamidase PncC